MSGLTCPRSGHLSVGWLGCHLEQRCPIGTVKASIRDLLPALAGGVIHGGATRHQSVAVAGASAVGFVPSTVTQGSRPPRCSPEAGRGSALHRALGDGASESCRNTSKTGLRRRRQKRVIAGAVRCSAPSSDPNTDGWAADSRHQRLAAWTATRAAVASALKSDRDLPLGTRRDHPPSLASSR